jgi:hypothetical protein
MPGRLAAAGPALRRFARALHRDLGFFAAGLTGIYALSGLAVNHIEDWDPNFAHTDRSAPFALSAADGHLAETDLTLDAAARARLGTLALEAAGWPAPARETFASGPANLDVVHARGTLYVDLTRGQLREVSERERLLLRVANWLHLNRGKRAWTYIADAYAITLLLLVATGFALPPGRRGLLGRGGVVALAGAAVPALYVLLSGGP